MAQAAPDTFYRKLVDAAGNIYVVAVPVDVNPSSVEDILIGANEGIVKLLAYRLVDDVYRGPDQMPLVEAGKKFNSFTYKKLEVFADGKVSKKDFSNAMQHLIQRYKEDSSKIGKIRVEQWGGHKILKNPTTGSYYIEREISCNATGCDHTIKGILPLTLDESGNVARTQSFKPYDKSAARVRQGSKLWFCGDCSVTHIEPPAPPAVQTPVENKEAEAATPPTEEKKRQGQLPPDILEILEGMSDPTADTDPTYFKGFVHGLLLMRR